MPDIFYLLGWNLFFTTVLAIIVWSLCRTPRLRRRPAICHALWLLVLLKLVTPPIVSMPGTLAATEPSEVAASPAAIRNTGCECGTPASAVTVPPTSASTPSGTIESDPFIAILGMSLLVTCILWIAAARRIFQVRRLLRNSAVEADRATELLRQVSQQFNLRTQVSLQMVDAPITPMLWAMPGSPTIILPKQLAYSLDDDGLRSIFAHELAHFVHRDHWFHSFAFVAATLWWWNPLVWFARRQLSASAELCCDAMALERLRGSRKAYASTLLTVVDSFTSPAPLRSSFGIAFGESRSLRKRFEMIADANVKARMSRGGWILLAVSFFALMLLSARAQDLSTAADKATYGCDPVPSQLQLPELCCPT